MPQPEKLDYARVGLGHPRAEYLLRAALRILAKAFLSTLILVLSTVLLLRSMMRPTDMGYGVSKSLRVDERRLLAALDKFEFDCGRYPTDEEGLQALVSQPAGTGGWNGPYLTAIPLSPWGDAYVYRAPQQGGGGCQILCRRMDGPARPVEQLIRAITDK